MKNKRETNREKDCNDCLCRILDSCEPDKMLEELKAITLRWYLYGKADGLDYSNGIIFEDYED